MFNNLVIPPDETERQIIHRPPQRHLFPCVGSPLLPTNPFTSVTDFILFRRLMEPALEWGLDSTMNVDRLVAGFIVLCPPRAWNWPFMSAASISQELPSVHRTTASTFKQCFGPGLHKRFLTNEKKVLSSPGLAPINKCITYSS